MSKKKSTPVPLFGPFALKVKVIETITRFKFKCPHCKTKQQETVDNYMMPCDIKIKCVKCKKHFTLETPEPAVI